MAVFTKSEPNLIESDEGFSVRVKGLTQIEYRAGDRTVLVEFEFLARPAGIAIYPGSVKSWSSGGPVSEEDVRKIVDDIKRAFASDGTKVDVL